MKKQGDLAGALAAYRERLAVAQKDPDNMTWQSDRAIAGHKIASTLVSQRELDMAVTAQQEAVAAIRQTYTAHPATAAARDEQARALGALSWVLLLADRPREALDSTQEALALNPALPFVRTHQAHALLLPGRFDDAYELYSEMKDKSRGDGKTFASVVPDDFAEFRKRGIDAPAMARIEALLAEGSATPR